MTFQRIAAVAACTIVAIGVVLAFGVIGTPSHQRLLALDQRRTTDLYDIAQTIGNPAPIRLADIHMDNGIDIRDPVTHKPYEYHRKNARRYELCATFALPSDPDANRYYGRNWKHPAGHSCRWFNV